MLHELAEPSDRFVDGLIVTQTQLNHSILLDGSGCQQPFGPSLTRRIALFEGESGILAGNANVAMPRWEWSCVDSGSLL